MRVSWAGAAGVEPAGADGETIALQPYPQPEDYPLAEDAEGVELAAAAIRAIAFLPFISRLGTPKRLMTLLLARLKTTATFTLGFLPPPVW